MNKQLACLPTCTECHETNPILRFNQFEPFFLEAGEFPSGSMVYDILDEVNGIRFDLLWVEFSLLFFGHSVCVTQYPSTKPSYLQRSPFFVIALQRVIMRTLI